MKFSLPKIYPITDRQLSGQSHAEQVRQFIDGGAGLVQIRDKSAPSRDLYKDAREAVDLAHENSILIIINDRVDIAMMTGADGVHLGQDDLPASEARKLLGENAIIGVSTHNLAQARQAAAGKIADYIAFGPIFGTSTKPDHELVVGLDKLREIRTCVSNTPLVAIGGINRENLNEIFSAQAVSAAMISEFYDQNASISTRYHDLTQLIKCTNIV